VTRSICRYRAHVCPFIALCYLFNDAIISIIASNYRIGEWSIWKRYDKTWSLPKRSRYPDTSWRDCENPQTSGYPASMPKFEFGTFTLSVCLTIWSNYRFFNLREIQDSQCLIQPSHILLVILTNFNITVQCQPLSHNQSTIFKLRTWGRLLPPNLSLSPLHPPLVKPCLRRQKVFWIITPYLSLGGEHHSLWGTQRIHLQGWMGGSMSSVTSALTCHNKVSEARPQHKSPSRRQNL